MRDGRSLLARTVDGLFAPPSRGAVACAWRDYPLWQRVVAGFFGYSLAPQGSAADSSPAWGVRQSESMRREAPGLVWLPRFDRATLRVAATASTRRGLLDTVVDGTRYVLRDAGGGRLGVIVESTDETVAGTALAVTVETPDGSAGYLLPFTAGTAGRWLGNASIPGLESWADVAIGERRALASLGAHDVEVVTRSVRAALGDGVVRWAAAAAERPDGDPVREAIERGQRP